MDLVFFKYEITENFPRIETFGLVSQMHRAAISTLSDIAEAAADRSSIQFRNLLSVAIGSLNEFNSQIEMAFRIGYLNRRYHD